MVNIQFDGQQYYTSVETGVDSVVLEALVLLAVAFAAVAFDAAVDAK